MPHPQIKFGTDGWRGVIAADFTFANVRTAAEAVAAYVHAAVEPFDADAVVQAVNALRSGLPAIAFVDPEFDAAPARARQRSGS